jgi:hypothetical protein
MADPSGDPIRYPQADEMFVRARDGVNAGGKVHRFPGAKIHQ